MQPHLDTCQPRLRVVPTLPPESGHNEVQQSPAGVVSEKTEEGAGWGFHHPWEVPNSSPPVSVLNRYLYGSQTSTPPW